MHDFCAVNDVDSRLAVELALKLRTPQELLHTYNLSPGALAAKLKNPMFQDMVAQARMLWKSDLNAKERIRLKSQMLVEDSLLAAFGMVHNEQLAPQPRLEALKQLSRLADVEATEKQQGAQGTRFTVHINLGEARAPVVIDAASQEDHDDG